MDSIDWLDNPKSRFYWRPEKLKNRLLGKIDSSKTQAGKIILFHLGSMRPDADRPVHMLASFIDEARQKGFSFKTIGEALSTSELVQTTKKVAPESVVTRDISGSASSIGK